jgi:hypothetical protein
MYMPRASSTGPRNTCLASQHAAARHAGGVKFLRMENDAAVFEVGSGSYDFTCPLSKP